MLCLSGYFTLCDQVCNKVYTFVSQLVSSNCQVYYKKKTKKYYVTHKISTMHIKFIICLFGKFRTYFKRTTTYINVLFISYKFVIGFLAITFLLLLISSWNFHDVCQCFLCNQKRISVWSDKKGKFPYRPPL